MRVLIAFGSKRGGTAGLADMIGEALREAGCETVVCPARGHVTFGGRLLPHATGFPASAMAKTHAGDWRDENHVKSWTESVVATLASRKGAD